MANGYEQTYYLMRKSLAGLDFAGRAQDLGLSPPEGGTQRLTFLGHDYWVDETGVYPEGSDNTSFNTRSVIIYYLTYGGKGEASYDFRTMHSFSHGLFEGDSSSSKWGTAYKGPRLSLEFFEAAAKRIGAEFMQKKNGAHSYLLFPFPKVPALLTYNEGDDEFPDDMVIKFGTNALNFLPFETLAVLHGLIVRSLTRD